jgi:hypothetical protein
MSMVLFGVSPMGRARPTGPNRSSLRGSATSLILNSQTLLTKKQLIRQTEFMASPLRFFVNLVGAA